MPKFEEKPFCRKVSGDPPRELGSGDKKALIKIFEKVLRKVFLRKSSEWNLFLLLRITDRFGLVQNNLSPPKKH